MTFQGVNKSLQLIAQKSCIKGASTFDADAGKAVIYRNTST
jgi:hypothetical protein